MFDIGFQELALIGLVALIVIGPERLPAVARTAGLWFGRMRGFVATVKADIDKQIKAEELQKVLQKQADSAGLHEIIEETKSAVETLDKPAEYLVKSDSSDKPAAPVAEQETETKQQDNVDKS